jgi:hypothetical protein
MIWALNCVHSPLEVTRDSFYYASYKIMQDIQPNGIQETIHSRNSTKNNAHSTKVFQQTALTYYSSNVGILYLKQCVCRLLSILNFSNSLIHTLKGGAPTTM